MKRLLWIDLETTGLDPVEDCILEIGAVITDEYLDEETDFHAFPESGFEAKFSNVFVAKMHQENGLIKERREADTFPFYEMIDDFYHWILDNNAIGLELAGSNPSFDRSFIEAKMPKVAALFSHRHFDTSTLRILHDVKKRDGEITAHRSLPDIRADIEFVKQYLPLEETEYVPDMMRKIEASALSCDCSPANLAMRIRHARMVLPFSFEEYSKKAHETAVPGVDDSFTYCALKLAGEAGEVADKFGKFIRDKGCYAFADLHEADREAVMLELGDVLWYVNELALRVGFSLAQVARANNEKLASRAARGKLGGDGDER
jgi:oligoribonuclease (3'-5' exoribonuclease)/NTP pyrophosphatase (non-canonical NTP hydrolase)